MKRLRCPHRAWDPNLTRAEIQRSPKRAIRWLFRRITSPWRGLPSIYIAGARKCGTTSLFYYLVAHPHLLPPFRKEVKFFTFQFYLGTLWYRANFPFVHQLRGRMTLDATATYLMHPWFAQRAYALTPHARVIVLVRNPVKRVLSMYNQNRRRGLESLPLEKVFEREQSLLSGERERLADPCYSPARFELYGYLWESCYIEHLERLWTFFPPEQVLVLRSEDLFASPQEVMAQVYRFLDLQPFQQTSFRIYNPGHYRVDASLKPAVAWLQEYFAPYNQRLYNALGRDLGWERECIDFD